jgi:hypothetical protein
MQYPGHAPGFSLLDRQGEVQGGGGCNYVVSTLRRKVPKLARATMVTCIRSDALQQGRFKAALFVMAPDFLRAGLDLELAGQRADFLPGALHVYLGQQPLEILDHPLKPVLDPVMRRSTLGVGAARSACAALWESASDDGNNLSQRYAP